MIAPPIGVAVGCTVAVGVTVGIGVIVAVGVFVVVGVTVGVAVGCTDDVTVGVGVLVAVGVTDTVGAGVTVGVGVAPGVPVNPIASTLQVMLDEIGRYTLKKFIAPKLGVPVFMALLNLRDSSFQPLASVIELKSQAYSLESGPPELVISICPSPLNLVTSDTYSQRCR